MRRRYVIRKRLLSILSVLILAGILCRQEEQTYAAEGLCEVGEIQIEEIQTEETQTGENQTEEIQAEELRTEEARTEEIQTEESQAAETQTEESQTEEPQTRTSGTEEIQPAGKADGTACVTLEGWVYSPDNSSANSPVPISETNGTEHITYFYKERGADDSAYTQEVPSSAGAYTVKAVFAETEKYKEITAVADFIISRARPVISFEKVPEELSGDAVFCLRVVAVGEAELFLESSDEKVAVVDKETGMIRFIGNGRVQITAGMEESRNYEAQTVVMVTTVEKVKKMAAVVLETETYQKVYGDQDFTIGVLLKMGDADIRYRSDNGNVAEVDAQGNVTIKGAGEAVITAFMEENEDYLAASDTVLVHVDKARKPESIPIDDVSNMTVSPDVDRLREIVLREGWSWENPDTGLVPGGCVSAVAVYEENANYERYEMTIPVCRAAKIAEDATDDLYVIGKDVQATIECTGALSEFRGLLVDGAAIAKSDYTVREGSTIITFIQSFLDRLAPGSHRIVLSYTAGDVETILNVREAERETDTEESNKETETGQGETDHNEEESTDQDNTDNNKENANTGNTDRKNADKENTDKENTGGEGENGRNHTAPQTADECPLECVIVLLLISLLYLQTGFRHTYGCGSFRDK